MINLDLDEHCSKHEVKKNIENYLQHTGFQIVNSDFERPWGGFFVIEEAQTRKFIDLYFADLNTGSINLANKLSPKILVVAPKQRLSWQYHFRRSELWKVIGGTAAISISDTDEQKGVKEIKKGEIIILKQGERHRLIGTHSWGVVAEIWQHTDLKNPSDEMDIVRVEDDFGR